MIYPANFEQKIGFDRLREQVAALCTMRAARGKLAEETFSASAREIGRRLELADQMRLLLDMEHDFPGGEYPDVDHVVAKLRVEGTFLDVGEVVTLHRALSLVGSVVAFILAREGQYPALYARSRGVEAFPGIVQRIDAIVSAISVTMLRRPCWRSGAPSANAKGRPPSGCRRCSPPPKGPVSSMLTPRSRSAKGRP